jgi:hypothetical protein
MLFTFLDLISLWEIKITYPLSVVENGAVE